MRLARARTIFGEVEGDKLHVLNGNFLAGATRSGETLNRGSVQFLSPVQPGS
jgi:hypothetical protein